MGRVLYFDGFSGISGDMVLGAFLDAGLPLDDLRAALGSLGLDEGCSVHAERVLRAGVSATKFSVRDSAPVSASASASAQPAAGSRRPSRSRVHRHSDGTTHQHGADDAAQHDDLAADAGGTTAEYQEHDHTHAHRSVEEIVALIGRSALSPAGRARAVSMIRRLADVEAAIHQMPVEEVHLHEVGALDSIIDIVGAVFAMEWAGVDRVVCSPLNVGSGMVRSAHGLFPVPAPATLALLGEAPVYGGTIAREMVTPSGALIATTYADAFGPIPQMSIERVGYGAGGRDNPGTPNVLRVLIGREADRSSTAERVCVVECEIDDMNPQLFGSTMERLYAAGAVEVFYVPVQMKKNRPGTLVTAIAPPRLRDAVSEVLFRETTTIGLRHYEVDRECLRREIVTIDTSLGPIRFKLAWRDGRIVNAVPEFEDCAALSRTHHLSVKDVQALALQAYGRQATPPPL